MKSAKLYAPLIAAALVAGVAAAQMPELAEPIPAEAPSVESVIAQPAPAEAVVAAGPACCPIEVVAYRSSFSAKRAYRCYGAGTPMSVCVDNPADCDCTLFEVPMCVPCCCVGEPTMCNARVGLLGRGKVDVVWDCGFTATVVFKVHGGAIVAYDG